MRNEITTIAAQESRRPDLYYESADERIFSYKGRIYAREFVVVERSHSDVTYRRIVQIALSRDAAGKAANRRNIAAWDKWELSISHAKQNPDSLYSSFHGANPARTRQVTIETPKRLIKIGRLISVVYKPESPSKRKGTYYEHKFGDTGERMLPNKPILAVSEDGKQLFIVNDEATPNFEERGIVG